MSLQVSVKKRLGRFTLDVAFEHEDGVLGLLGESGCGKSMTLRCIAGIVKPDEGRITLNGRVLFDSEKKINLPPQARRVGYLFQRYVLFPNMTVEENLRIAMKGSRAAKKARAAEMLAQLYLAEHGKKYPSQLSGGQQQRVALARMLAAEPELILLDEPFSALDNFLKTKLSQSMHELFASFPGGIVYVTHNRDEISQFCDYVTVLDRGKVTETVRKEELFRRPRRLSTAKLSGVTNYSRLSREADGTLKAADWGASLTPARAIAPAIHYIGVRSHALRFSDRPGEGPCIRVRVERTVDELFEEAVYCRALYPDGSPRETEVIRADVPKEHWEAFKTSETLYLTVPDEAILYLEA